MKKPYGRRGKRRIWWIPLLAICLACFLWWENASIQVTHTDVTLARLPDGFAGATVAVLGDLQGMEFGDGHSRLLEAVAAEAPEMIFLVGDVVDRYRQVEDDYLPTLARGLADIAPTYFVTGNHEWAVGDVRALKVTLEAAGVVVLSNRFVPWMRNGDTILLAGIDDPNGYADQKTPQALAAEIEQVNPACWFLLAHRNDRFAGEYSLLGADLVISGHGHGGMIRLPFADGLVDHQKLFPSYTAGVYRQNDSTLFVTRGLGNSPPALRLFNRPEVAILTLMKHN